MQGYAESHSILKSSHDILNASYEKLLQIKGIGKSLIEKIRNSKNY
jgi:ERCC4-type nuclease